MVFALFDEFEQVLGDTHKDLESAKHALLQLGEASGEVGIIELTQSVEDMSDLSDLDAGAKLRRWRFDSLTEELVLDEG
jgi:hypothetical protein